MSSGISKTIDWLWHLFKLNQMSSSTHSSLQDQSAAKLMRCTKHKTNLSGYQHAPT